jgi:hypothetical protein
MRMDEGGAERVTWLRQLVWWCDKTRKEIESNGKVIGSLQEVVFSNQSVGTK